MYARTARGIGIYFEINVVYVYVGLRSDIYFGNCFRMMGVGWGLDTYLGN